MNVAKEVPREQEDVGCLLRGDERRAGPLAGLHSEVVDDSCHGLCSNQGGEIIIIICEVWKRRKTLEVNEEKPTSEALHGELEGLGDLVSIAKGLPCLLEISDLGPHHVVGNCQVKFFDLRRGEISGTGVKVVLKRRRGRPHIRRHNPHHLAPGSLGHSP